jgi:hypothetical protein
MYPLSVRILANCVFDNLWKWVLMIDLKYVCTQIGVRIMTIRLLSFAVGIVLCLNIFNVLDASLVLQDNVQKVFDTSFGETVSGSVQLYNPTHRPLNVRISQADFVYNERDERFFIEPGKYARSNANWIRYTGLHTIPPFETYNFTFSVSVPNQRELVGSYWSILFIEEDIHLFDTHNDIVFQMRFAVLVINNIRNTGDIDFNFNDIVFTNDSVSLILHNTGSLWFETTIKIDIFNDNAQLIGRYSFEGNSILPGLGRVFNFPIQTMISGNYHAVIVAEVGDNQIFGHQVSFTIR